jgi:hypothetical protein
MKILLIILFSITNCYAIDVTPVKKGDIVKTDGFHIDQPNMKKLRKINEDKKVLEKKVTKLEDLAAINEQRVETYKKLSQESEDQLRWEKTKGNFKGIGGFLVGVLATSLAAYAAIRISK